MGTRDEISTWLAERIPPTWFEAGPELAVDRDEVLIVGRLQHPPDARDGAVPQTIKRFREETRAQRVGIAREMEQVFGRKVSWGVECAGEREIFTALSLPIMTRLRMEERAVLDALVDARVARNRSQALAWCVRLVRRHQGPWIEQLVEALEEVDRVRARGPDVDGDR